MMETKSDMIRASHLAPPGESLSFPKISLSPISEITNLELAEAYTKLRADSTVPEVILKLAELAQNSKTKPQSSPIEAGTTRTVLDLGTQAQGDHTLHDTQFRTTRNQPATPHPRDIHPHNTEEADLRQRLLSNPMVNETDNLGWVPLTMGGNSDQEASDPPWFTKPIASNVPTLTAINQFGQNIELPYLRYGLIEDEPYLLGTTGRSGGVYREPLKAFPMEQLPFETCVDDDDLKLLYTDHPFNWTLNLALYHMGDAGILADVHRYRSSYQKLKQLQSENAQISWILLVLQKEQEQHNSEIGTFIEVIKGIRMRLVMARVMSQVDPVLHQMAIEGRILNMFYPQIYEETIPNPVNPSASTPILRPTNPELPSSIITPYILKTPTPNPQPIPPKMKYAASSFSGPLHQPTMFDTEDNHGWPPPSATTTTWPEERQKKMAHTHSCHYCNQQGHWNSQCSSPHLKCHEELACVVSLEHPAFIRACSFGGRTSTNHPLHKGWKKQKRHGLQPINFTPPITPSNTFNDGMPSPDSLLFSANLETHPLISDDALTRSFHTSPY
jgi:hypothetical protein